MWRKGELLDPPPSARFDDKHENFSTHYSFQINHLEAKCAAESRTAEAKKRVDRTLEEEIDQVDRIKGYYECELAKKDEIIAQQREVIKLLTQK